MWRQISGKGPLSERARALEQYAGQLAISWVEAVLQNTGKLRTYWKGRKEMFYLTTHSTHFIYGYMASGIW